MRSVEDAVGVEIEVDVVGGKPVTQEHRLDEAASPKAEPYSKNLPGTRTGLMAPSCLPRPGIGMPSGVCRRPCLMPASVAPTRRRISGSSASLLNEYCAPAVLRQRGRYFRTGVGVELSHDDPSSFGGKATRGCCADSLTSAGDDCRLAFKAGGHAARRRRRRAMPAPRENRFIAERSSYESII